jgi:hypothetical protein
MMLGTAPRPWSGADTAALGLPKSPFVAVGLPLEAVPSLTNSTKNGTYP